MEGDTKRLGLRFEWDEEKAHRNERKHGVTFAEAASVFGDPLSLTISDPAHSSDEDRFVILGQSGAGRLLVLIHAEKAGIVRLISARLATRRERTDYEEGN